MSFDPSIEDISKGINIKDEDLIVHILSQLGDDFAHVPVAMKSRNTPITFPDLFEKLIDHERNIKVLSTAPMVATVNNTQKAIL
ncbi:hypothetical protein E3N88_38577 [Mikania micrantha]|uniref:Uncharacterized protein n=1 Tax=Mikania micrantha TaxID=192012 RepID=A0A5N6LUN4_9ASTR|nr:hypothetical protein E3N88_38577 [Mikania micrantha]